MTGGGAELVLSGGNVTSGVVRVGNTIRRPLTRHSDRVHGLLLHLERAGFAASPRFLGLDGQGRAILTYLGGDTALPDWHYRECTKPKAAAFDANRAALARNL